MNRLARTLPALMLSLLLGACGGSPAGSAPTTGSPPKGAGSDGPEVAVEDVKPAALLDSRPLESGTMGALHGVILVKGKVPERFPIGARKISDCCKVKGVVHMSDIVVAEEGKLMFAYVRVLLGKDQAQIPPAPKAPLVVDQRGCIYTPHVSAMQLGQQLHIKSSDPTTHNVNLSAPANRKKENLAMVAGQAPLEFDFRRPDVVKLRCDIHPWMSAWVHVSEHPWFAVSDKDGAFSIPDLPPGQYVIEVQHEEFGILRGSVTIEGKQSTGVSFEFVLD